MAIEEGGTGLDHVALRVGSDDILEAYAERLAASGIAVDRTGGTEPGQPLGLRVTLPSQISLELITVTDPAYPHSDHVAYPARSDAAPVDFDHVNIRSPAFVDDVQFLQEHVGMRISEVLGTEDEWKRAFVRCNQAHHDIAMGPRSTDATDNHPLLHHISFSYAGAEHLTRAIDRLSRGGIELENGLSRHYAGDNLYAYFIAPGGNRIELTAEMARIHTEEVVYSPST